MKDTGCVGLQLSIILMQTVGRFDNDLIPLILNKRALFTPGVEQNIELFVIKKHNFGLDITTSKAFLANALTEK